MPRKARAELERAYWKSFLKAEAWVEEGSACMRPFKPKTGSVSGLYDHNDTESTLCQALGAEHGPKVSAFAIFTQSQACFVNMEKLLRRGQTGSSRHASANTTSVTAATVTVLEPWPGCLIRS